MNELTLTGLKEKVERLDEGNALILIRKNPGVYPHYSTYSQTDKLANLQAIMVKCYQLRHIKDISFIKYDSQDLVQAIDKNTLYRNMSFEEIKTAFTNGAMDKYGECKGLTVAFFLKCLNHYIDENRQNYIEAERQKEMEAKKEYEAKMLANTKMKLEASKRRAAIERAAQEMLYNNKI